tara:strand:- start:9 stop:254 length:246 start_codon:yes stop_codon:yes gene_type:complete
MPESLPFIARLLPGLIIPIIFLLASNKSTKRDIGFYSLITLSSMIIFLASFEVGFLGFLISFITLTPLCYFIFINKDRGFE